MHVEISNYQIIMLNSLKNNMLLDEYNNAYVLKHFEIKSEIINKKQLFRTKKTVKNYLVKIDILGYNTKTKTLNSISNLSCILFINDDMLYDMRQNWIHFIEQINEFGFEMKAIAINI